MKTHGTPVRGASNVSQSPLLEGRFGRMFRRLPSAPEYPDGVLQSLAALMQEPVPQPTGWAPAVVEDFDNPAVPAGYTYFGQFLDHDVTFDAASSVDQTNDPEALVSFRTPRFDLDSVYGSGPEDEPFQYDRSDPWRLLVVEDNGNGVADLPRNNQGLALIGDPRNDENVIVSQLHLVFLRLHNKFLDEARAAGCEGEWAFLEAQRMTRWHYQWVVIHDFLPRILDPATLSDIFQTKPPKKKSEAVGPPEPGALDVERKYYRPQKNAYIPIEFSAAAYRFGHSMIRGKYNLNAATVDRPIFLPGDAVGETDDLRGRRLLPGQWSIDWSLFFVLNGSIPQPSRKIDAKLIAGLNDLPGPNNESLAFRNLRTGQRHKLPSGQDVAQAMRIPPLTQDQLGGSAVPVPTPLWFYILKESEVGGGSHLGPVGSRIVGEVLGGMLELDRQSYLSQQPSWQPTIPKGQSDKPEEVTLADLIVFAGT